MDRTSFIFAGNATFTVLSLQTQNRFTYNVRKCDTKDSNLYFVSVLTGPDTYQYIGVLTKQSGFKYGKKSKIGEDAKSVISFSWICRNIESDKIQIYHEGMCGRCGRPLTTPESIELGFGPKCKDLI